MTLDKALECLQNVESLQITKDQANEIANLLKEYAQENSELADRHNALVDMVDSFMDGCQTCE